MMLRLDCKALETKPVQPCNKEVTLTTQLTPGSHQLATTFAEDAGNEIGAYYAISSRGYREVFNLPSYMCFGAVQPFCSKRQR